MDDLLADYYDAWVDLQQEEQDFDDSELGHDWGTSNTFNKLPRMIKLNRLRAKCEDARLKLFLSIARERA